MYSAVNFPPSLLSHIKTILPTSLCLDEFIHTCQQPLRKSIRVNTLKISVADFVAHAKHLDWQLTPVPWCQEGFWLTRPVEQDARIPLGNTPEHLLGLFYIQEASSMLPPQALLQDGAPTLVLDMAAAPGSKTTQLGAMMCNHGMLVANELSSSRIKSMVANIQRMGVTNTAISHFDGQVFGQWLPNTFDAVLLDAPCGGEGVIRKDPNALKNWSPQAVAEASALQKKLIESAFHALKLGGILVYSTCTLNSWENQQVCRHLLEQFPGAVNVLPLDTLFEGASQALTPEGYLHVWPQIYDSEGFFVARFQKTKLVPQPSPPQRQAKFPFSLASGKQQRALVDYLEKRFGCTLPQDGMVYVRNNDYWWFPPQFEPLQQRFRFDRIGLKIATLHGQTFRLSHEAAMALGGQFSNARIELDDTQLGYFFQGRDIFFERELTAGEVLVTYKGYPVGLGKGIGARLKNALPRELVRDDALKV